MAGRAATIFSIDAVGTFMVRSTLWRASMTPNRSVRISSISRRFCGSAQLFLFAMIAVWDSMIWPMILSPFLRRVVPVSVRSTTTSIRSGTFASEAPYEWKSWTGIFRSSKNFRVSSGYSVVTREPGRIWVTFSMGSSRWTAITIFTFPSPVLL